MRECPNEQVQLSSECETIQVCVFVQEYKWALGRDINRRGECISVLELGHI